MGRVPEIRVRAVNDAPISESGQYVVYWMIAARRTTWNFGLDRAVEWAERLQCPLVVFEALRVDYPWASDRLHRFVIEGMLDNARRLEGSDALYYPYVEPQHDAGKGLLVALAERAAVIVTDDFPAFFLPHMLASAGRQLSVRLEAVDSNGILPLAAANRVFTTAYSFRRFLQKTLRPHLEAMPRRDALRRAKFPAAKPLPAKLLKRWPPAKLDDLLNNPDALAQLPIDHRVGPAAFRGGSAAGRAALKKFLRSKFGNYTRDRNEPEQDATSGLSPYLHFGHISVHEVFQAVAEREAWSVERLAQQTLGQRGGWWGMSENAEGFIDQLITWRELGANMAAHCPDYERFESLPPWALTTLERHAHDRREFVYTLEEFEQAQTHDPLWNAAQRQLVREGRLHNYLRMLWGKKILHWSASPREALDVMIELNNKYALDGRDPNSYSGIFWVLGRYDRAWGPERPIFGKVRYMSSENTARKFSVKNFIEKYST